MWKIQKILISNVEISLIDKKAKSVDNRKYYYIRIKDKNNKEFDIEVNKYTFQKEISRISYEIIYFKWFFLKRFKIWNIRIIGFK